jgi:hypothetical protein
MSLKKCEKINLGSSCGVNSIWLGAAQEHKSIEKWGMLSPSASFPRHPCSKNPTRGYGSIMSSPSEVLAANNFLALKPQSVHLNEVMRKEIFASKFPLTAQRHIPIINSSDHIFPALHFQICS